MANEPTITDNRRFDREGNIIPGKEIPEPAAVPEVPKNSEKFNALIQMAEHINYVDDRAQQLQDTANELQQQMRNIEDEFNAIYSTLTEEEQLAMAKALNMPVISDDNQPPQQNYIGFVPTTHKPGVPLQKLPSPGFVTPMNKKGDK